jgi:hypothetical protein
MAKLSELKKIDEVIEEHREGDPEFRERWDRARFARAVAVEIIGYRTATLTARDGPGVPPRHQQRRRSPVRLARHSSPRSLGGTAHIARPSPLTG